MQMTIKSKILGEEFTFSVPGSKYVYVDSNGQPGALGQQICYGGDFIGVTVMVSNASEFERECRAWIRARIKWMRQCGLIK